MSYASGGFKRAGGKTIDKDGEMSGGDKAHDPTNLSLGQLTDDLQEIKKIARGESDPVSQDFVKVSSILAAIGHQTAW